MADWCINPAARGLDLNFKVTSLHFRLPNDDIVHGSASRGRILLSIAAQTRASPQKNYWIDQLRKFGGMWHGRCHFLARQVVLQRWTRTEFGIGATDTKDFFKFGCREVTVG
jgi:hypothetical protein